MPTYLYCLLDPVVDPPAGLRGVAGEPIRLLADAPLAAWVGSVPAVPAPSVDSARAHDGVLDTALDRVDGGAVLPARYGQALGEDSDWRVRIDEKRLSLAEALGRLAGCVEMAVVIATRPPIASEPRRQADTASGREYLERLREGILAEQRWRSDGERLRERVTGRVGALALEERVSWRPAGGRLTVSHLVRVGDVAGYREALKEIDVEGGEMVVAGPSAPASFVSASP